MRGSAHNGTVLGFSERRVLDGLLEVSPGMRVSDLERWRKGPPPRRLGEPAR